jgi:hypothetical protein
LGLARLVMTDNQKNRNDFAAFLQSLGGEAPPNGFLDQYTFRAVSDPAGTAVRIMEFAFNHGPKGFQINILSRELNNVAIKGNRATGTLVDVDGTTGEAKFILLRDRWYIDF